MELVSLNDELDFVKKYLSPEKSRFGNRLTINVDIDKEVKSKMIPPMLIQPLIENAIKHGISPLVEGGEISIKTFKEKGRVDFNISDTGLGIKDKEGAIGKGVGLTNTKLRLEKMYDSELTITNNQPKGTQIKFSI